jgi:hypothetical protein
MAKIRRTIQCWSTRTVDKKSHKVVDGHQAFWKRFMGLPLRDSVHESTGVVLPGVHKDVIEDDVRVAVRGLQIERLLPHLVRGSFYKIRMVDLEAVKNVNDGSEKPMALGDFEGTVSKSHFLWLDLAAYPKSTGAHLEPEGLLMIEHHGNAEGAGMLANYASSRDSLVKIHVDPMLDKDRLKDLDKADNIRDIEFRIPSFKLDDLGGEMSQLRGAVDGVEEVWIRIKAGHGGNIGVRNRGVAWLRKLLPDPKRTRAKDDVDVRVDFRGDVQRSLVRAVIQQTVEVIRTDDRTRGVLPDSIFSGIERYFNENIARLSAATGRDLSLIPPPTAAASG